MKIIKLGNTRGTNWHAKIGRVGNHDTYHIMSDTFRKFAYISNRDKFIPVGTGNGNLPKKIENQFWKEFENL